MRDCLFGSDVWLIELISLSLQGRCMTRFFSAVPFYPFFGEVPLKQTTEKKWVPLLTRLPPAAADPRRIKGKVTRTGPETRPQTQGPLIRSSTTTNKD